MRIIVSRPDQTTDPESVDLTHCDREPIRYIQAIQPHGVLLIVEEPGFRIVQYSANAAGFLGLAPLDWHNHTLDRLLGEDNIRTLQAALQGKSLDQVYLYLFTLSSPLHPERSFHLFANRSDGLLLLELERADAVSDPGTHAEWHMFHNALRCLKQSGRLPAFLEQVTTMIKTFTGFERVMVYQFKPDLSGHVIAEALEPGLEPYLNLHFPVGDIPLPARQMLQLVHFRFVPDIDYEPVPLLPDFTTAGLERPVDLGFSGLRSASIMCRLYKQNMNTRSTLVIPLLINGKLWGLLSCHHHSTTHYLAYPERVSTALFAQAVARSIQDHENQEHEAYRSRLHQGLSAQMERVSRHVGYPLSATAVAGMNLLESLDAEGVAIAMEGVVILQGLTPTETQVKSLILWLTEQNHMLYVTDGLSQDYPLAVTFDNAPAGLIAILLPKTSENAILWFRREYRHQVDWAGDPDKPASLRSDGSWDLHPRGSFERWTRMTENSSRGWLDCEVDYAQALHQLLSDFLLQRTRLVNTFNDRRSSLEDELDHFFHSAAHDLKDPLRGIRNYTQLIQFEEKTRLSDENLHRMDTILRTIDRMEETLQSLMAFSTLAEQAGSMTLHPLVPLISETAGIVTRAYPEEVVELYIQPDLPDTRCDRAKVCSIYQNLIRNAIKYNQSPVKRIDIGYEQREGIPVFFVRDNGIGIPAAYHATIFQLFRRLHSSQHYGGGSGVGLSIVKKAVEQHGGRIWLDSIPAQGTTFFFTLSSTGY